MSTFADGIRTAHATLQIMAMNNWGGSPELMKIRDIENEALFRAADEIIELCEEEAINYKSIQSYQVRIAQLEFELEQCRKVIKDNEYR